MISLFGYPQVNNLVCSSSMAPPWKRRLVVLFCLYAARQQQAAVYSLVAGFCVFRQRCNGRGSHQMRPCMHPQALLSPHTPRPHTRSQVIIKNPPVVSCLHEVYVACGDAPSRRSAFFFGHQVNLRCFQVVLLPEKTTPRVSRCRVKYLKDKLRFRRENIGLAVVGERDLRVVELTLRCCLCLCCSSNIFRVRSDIWVGGAHVSSSPSSCVISLSRVILLSCVCLSAVSDTAQGSRLVGLLSLTITSRWSCRFPRLF